MFFPEFRFPGLTSSNASTSLIFNNDLDIEERRFRRIREIFYFRTREEIEFQENTIPNDNKNCMKEKDIKYNLYPLYINWKQLETNEDDYYKIFVHFGYFGAAVYSLLRKVREDINYKNIFSIISFFYYIFFKCDNYLSTSLDKESLNRFIKLFPDIDEIYQLIENKIFLFKEIPMYMIVLKIYEIYFLFEKDYDKLLQLLKHEYILNSNITNDEYKEIYNKNFKGKVEKIFKNISEQKGKIYDLAKTRNNFINHLKRVYQFIKKEKEKEKKQKDKDNNKEEIANENIISNENNEADN